MTKTKEVRTETAFERMHSYAEKIKNDAPHSVATMSAGDAWAQGDVGLVCLDDIPPGCTRDPHPSSQLAPGNTHGSRHTLTDLGVVTLYRRGDATPLDGPVIYAPAGCTIEHPEHGNVTLPPGVYAVVYQRAFADELRRVQD